MQLSGQPHLVYQDEWHGNINPYPSVTSTMPYLDVLHAGLCCHGCGVKYFETSWMCGSANNCTSVSDRLSANRVRRKIFSLHVVPWIHHCNQGTTLCMKLHSIWEGAFKSHICERVNDLVICEQWLSFVMTKPPQAVLIKRLVLFLCRLLLFTFWVWWQLRFCWLHTSMISFTWWSSTFCHTSEPLYKNQTLETTDLACGADLGIWQAHEVLLNVWVVETDASVSYLTHKKKYQSRRSTSCNLYSLYSIS